MMLPFKAILQCNTNLSSQELTGSDKDLLLNSLRNEKSDFLFEQISTLNGKHNTNKVNFCITNKESLYLYRQKNLRGSQLGLIGLLPMEWLRARVKGHEKIFDNKVAHHSSVIKAYKYQTLPITLICKNVKLDDLPLSYCKDKFDWIVEEMGISHEIFTINNDQAVTSLSKHCEMIKEFIIADGHHRTMAMLEDQNISHVLVCLFPENQIDLSSINRALTFKENKHVSKFYSYCLEHPDLEVVSYEMKSDVFTVTYDQIKLTLRFKHTCKGGELISNFHKKILQTFLEKEQVANDLKISYHSKYAKFVKEQSNVIFIEMPNITIEEVFNIASKNETFPHHSTWFEPKLPNGFVNYKLINGL